MYKNSIYLFLAINLIMVLVSLWNFILNLKVDQILIYLFSIILTPISNAQVKIYFHVKEISCKPNPLICII